MTLSLALLMVWTRATMSQMLHMEIPNFGSMVLGSLNEQRLQGQYCDVSILVKGQAFRPTVPCWLPAACTSVTCSAAAAKSSLSCRPPSRRPVSSRSSASATRGSWPWPPSEQLVVMYTAGYLQIQHIVERGHGPDVKANSPHCDSATAAMDEPNSGPQSPSTHPLVPAGWSPSLPSQARRIKLEEPLAKRASDGTRSARARTPVLGVSGRAFQSGSVQPPDNWQPHILPERRRGVWGRAVRRRRDLQPTVRPLGQPLRK